MNNTAHCKSHQRNPLQRPPDGSEFEKDVRKVLELLGYKVDPDVRVNGRQTDLYAEYWTGEICLRLMIECKDESTPVGVEEVSQFAARVQIAHRHKIDKGLIVAKRGFTKDAKTVAADAGVQAVSFDDLSNRLVHFDSYIDRVIADFDRSAVSKYYIDLSFALTEDYYGSDSHLIQRPLDDAVNRIIAAEGHNQIALLGNFGTGKSTWCRKFARDMARRYRDDHHNRIPVVVSLSDYEGKLDIQELITSTLQFTYGLQISLTVCLELQRHGRFLFIFDGFDEMATRADSEVVRDNLRQINKVAKIQENLFIITCRTHFFRDKVQAEVLKEFETLYIPEWGEAELREYLEKRFGGDWQRHFDRIRGTHNLPELAETPLFLEMIAETLPKLGDHVRRTELYQTYTANWISEQSQRKGARLTSDERAAFVQDLAVKLYRDERVSCHYSEFSSLLQSRFQITDASAMDYVQSDVRNCTFVTRTSTGHYEFRHKSFMEYFVAVAMQVQIEKADTDLLSARGIPVEIRGFLVELIEQSPPTKLLSNWWAENRETVLGGNAFTMLAALGEALTIDGAVVDDETRSAAEFLEFLRGDPRALESIYTRYFPVLRDHLARLLGDVDEARDAAQEVMLRLIEERDRLEVGTSTNFRGFLLARASNVARRRTANNHLKANRSVYIENFTEFAAQIYDHKAPSPVDILVAKEQVEGLRKAMEYAMLQLPGRQRAIVQRVFIEGRRQSDVATEFGYSRSGLSTLISRTLASIRETIRLHMRESMDEG